MITFYSHHQAQRLAKLSDFVYAEPREAIDAAKRLGASGVRFVEANDTEAIVAKFERSVWVSFRGTQPERVRDVLTDARIKLRRFADMPGAVHSGFYLSVCNVFNRIIRSVCELMEPGGRVYFGGHSKGGAEALIFAKRFQQRGLFPVGGVHVFGCPAVGNRAFADAYQRDLGDRTFCHIHRSDLVARSPVLLRALGRYVQVGRTVYHFGDGRRTFNPSPLRLMVDGVRAFSRRLWRADHNLGHYLRGVE